MNNQSFPDDLPADEMGDYLRLYLDETNEQLDSLVEIFLQLENNTECNKLDNMPMILPAFKEL